MKRKLQGTLIKSSLVGGERYEAYVPNALPPTPAIDMMAISDWLEKANLAIGELNGVVQNAPDPSIINYMYVRKEAVLSSQIEGTQSTLDDLLRYESGDAIGTPIEDVAEVSSYVAALNHGLKRIEGGFPLSLRLIREIHKVLLTNARGKNKTPGEFRTSQNWIGGTRPSTARFVPAPPDKVLDLMGDLENFMHNEEDKIPLLVKTALVHQQFETIHPFLDGNGRTGRLLITLYLCERGFLKSPFLYLSLFFKKHRDLYYEKLDEIRKTGDWEDWLGFFLEGVVETAQNAKNTLLKIQKMFAEDDERVKGIGRARESVGVVLDEFKQKPMLTIAEITKRTGFTKPTAISAVNRLIALGIVKNISEKKWRQVYTYAGYTNLLTPSEK
ncbi:MAG: Fic family protein [Verrucomicrobiota bacterium]|jgi:Fic family protein|nr:Fic family protein [Verrucomicrobiota bacterium]